MGQFKAGDMTTGKVVMIEKYGAFVKLDESTTSLLHISEISNHFVKNINEILEIGQEIKVQILTLDQESNKISLSMRALEKKKADDASQDKGFAALENKMPEWIAKADKLER